MNPDSPQATEAPPSMAPLYAALAKAQGEFKPIVRNRTVTVRPRDTNKAPYTFAYAELDVVLAGVRDALCKNELALVQRIVRTPEGQEFIETVLAHSSGQSISNRVRMVNLGEGPQAYGSAQAYARRQGVNLILCVASEDDDDGNEADGNQATVVQRDDEPLGFARARGATMKVDPDIIDDYANRIVALVEQKDPAGAYVLYKELNQLERDAIWKHPKLTIKVKGALRQADRTESGQP